MDITRVFNGLALMIPLYLALMMFVMPATAIVTHSLAKTMRVAVLCLLAVVILALVRA